MYHGPSAATKPNRINQTLYGEHMQEGAETDPEPERQPTFKEKYEFLRDAIKHEDNLTNNRTTWLLVFHGLLFTAFVNGIGLYDKLHYSATAMHRLTTGLVILCTLGAVSAIATSRGTQAAQKQLAALDEWWTKQNGNDEAKTELFPPLYPYSPLPRLMSAPNLFWPLALVWVVFACLLVNACATTPEEVPPSTLSSTLSTPPR
jgi:hypothetical protein